LTDAQLVQLLEGRLPPPARAAALEHAEGCAACHGLLAAAAPLAHLEASPSAGAEEPEPIERGASVGRYVIMDRVGVGAMGEVHTAYDPELDRKVAIKILRPIDGAEAQDLGRRLLREAQTMARLSHPNVVAVYDAGTVQGRVFVAMELVPGQTLGRWLRPAGRPWRAVLAVLGDAGHGLAAAHAAGIVHRDFKPENVLVGSDGRVRVGDFGLARALAEASVRAVPEGAEPAAALTRQGTIMGTPAYMAPEQMRAEPAGPAADQFSFCVALHEALYRVRPYPGATLDELRAAIDAGAVRPAPPGTRVPARLRRALLRGLRARPEDRFPSMDALLAELGRDPGRVVRRGVAVAAVATALGGAALLVHQSGQSQIAACRAAGDALPAFWAEHRPAVEAAVLGGGEPYAPASWHAIAETLDRYVGAWRAMHIEACEATRVRGTQSEALFDLRVQCLARHDAELRALVPLLSTPAPGLVDQASRAVYALPPLARCQADEALAARTPPPPEAARADVERVRGALVATNALLRTGRIAPALAGATAVAQAALALDYLPLEGQALELLANAQLQRRNVDEAAQSFGLAFRAAAAGGDERTAASTLAKLVWLQGVLQGKFAEAASTARAAGEIAARIGDEAIGADVLFNQGILRFEQGDYAAARGHFARARDIRERLFGPRHPAVAVALNGLGRADEALGRLRDARSDYEQGLAIDEATRGMQHPELVPNLASLARVLWESFGEYDRAHLLFERVRVLAEERRADSPDVGNSLVLLGAVSADRGDYDEAIRLGERGLGLLTAGLPPEHELVTNAHLALAQSLAAKGGYDEALVQARTGLELRLKTRGPEHLEIADALDDLARIELLAGRSADALDHIARARALAAKLLPADHPLTAIVQLDLCRVLVATGPAPAALVACAQGLAGIEAAFGAGVPRQADALTLVGEAELAAKQPANAVAPLTRALAFLAPRTGDVLIRARARFALARARDDRALAEAARADLARVASADPRPLAAIDAWLAR
jgi:tetratricopeptide (TPR) repeat protein